jgi:hypothetical protein
MTNTCLEACKYIRTQLTSNLWFASQNLFCLEASAGSAGGSPALFYILGVNAFNKKIQLHLNKKAGEPPALPAKKIPILDHFAIIDLPGKYSGIPTLSHIFSRLGYVQQGADYLPEKQNDFAWLAEIDAAGQPAAQVLPQVVIADFRLDELPPSVAAIIEKYTAQVSDIPLKQIHGLLDKIELGDTAVAEQVITHLTDYFSDRAWPLPTVSEFNTVHACNELLAWVLVFGRIPNHFGLAIHLLPGFASLEAFMHFILEEVKLPLNEIDGRIKGHPSQGIQQGSTKGAMTTVQLADGSCLIPGQFMEFVWRYPKPPTPTAFLWDEYYTGFIPQNANRVIESLYV